MGREVAFWEDEMDQGCLGCGDTHFHESKTPGLCTECYGGSFTGSYDTAWDTDVQPYDYDTGMIW